MAAVSPAAARRSCDVASLAAVVDGLLIQGNKLRQNALPGEVLRDEPLRLSAGGCECGGIGHQLDKVVGDLPGIVRGEDASTVGLKLVEVAGRGQHHRQAVRERLKVCE